MNNRQHNPAFFFYLAGFFLFFLISYSVQGQKATIRGNVFTRETGEPQFLCNIQLLDTAMGMITDENGYFHFSQLDPGQYTLVFSSMGLTPDTTHVELKSGDIKTLRIYLEPSIKTIREVVVSAAHNRKKSQVQVSMQQVTPKELKRMPQLGAESDLSQYLQTLPGFVHSGEQGGQLYIRGGSEVQNSFLLDGIPVYNPFHSLSLFSVVDSDILQSVSIFSGGFSSDLGGRISSVMDTKTRDGNQIGLNGKFSLSTLGLNGEIEGPLGRKGLLENSSFLFSGKTSLINSLTSVLYPYLGSKGIPYGFTDLFGKLTKSGSNGSKINFTGFRFADRVDLDTAFAYDWSNYGIGCNVVIVPNNSSGLIRATLNYSSYKITWTEDEEAARLSKVASFRFLIESVNFFGLNELKIGIETTSMNSQLDYENLYGYELNERLFTTDMAAYIKYKIVLRKLILESGLRGSYYATAGVMIPEPRLGLKVNVTDRFRIKSAFGYYSQNLVSVKSDQDVVNYFTGYILEPQSIAKSFGSYHANNSLQTAWHLVAGIETEPLEALQINCELYAKYFPQTVTYNRNKRFSSSTLHSSVPDIYTASFLVEKGWAYGADLLVQYSSGRFFSQISYSLAFVRKYDGMQYYYPHYDRRHNLNLLASYYMGSPSSPWELNTHFSLGSGFPYTPVTSYYGKIDFNEFESNAVLNDYYSYGILFGETNSARLPVYHRLDLTIKHTFQLKRQGSLEVSFSVYNTYNRHNLFYFDVTSYSVQYQLPVLPVLGLKYIFK
jgi:hypothetical protein